MKEQFEPWSNSDAEQRANNLLYAWQANSGFNSTFAKLVVYLLLVIIERLDKNFHTVQPQAKKRTEETQITTEMDDALE